MGSLHKIVTCMLVVENARGGLTERLNVQLNA